MAFLLPVALVCCTGTFAQLRLGFLGGIHSANVLETNHLPGWDTAVNKYNSGRTGFQLGVMLEVPVGKKGFFFQPGLTYISKGRKYAKTNDSITALNTDTIYNKQTLVLNYVEIPLNFTYKKPLTSDKTSSLFVSGGPYISFIYGGHITSESFSQESKYFNTVSPISVGKGPDTYKTVDMGLNARVGFEMDNTVISAYYSRGLTNFYNATYPGTFHHQVFGISIGVWVTSDGPPRVRVIKDIDKDGIPDALDMCPTKPGTALWHGCPIPDTDHDGIDDEHDSCRTIPGLARYNGCPIPDSDGDGVNDEEDKCPHQVGLARYNGCPIPDRDGDGVNDEEDQCPDTAGPVENHGCPIKIPEPEIKKETTEEINYIARNILFNLASNQLADSSYKPLNELAGLLLKHPEWHLTIEGHTDNEGTAEHNRTLSEKRANAVKDFLVGKGLPATQVTSVGMGAGHPVASNATARGRAANRRVELKLSLTK